LVGDVAAVVGGVNDGDGAVVGDDHHIHRYDRYRSLKETNPRESYVDLVHDPENFSPRQMKGGVAVAAAAAEEEVVGVVEAHMARGLYHGRIGCIVESSIDRRSFQ
jgi:hypothetical protein